MTDARAAAFLEALADPRATSLDAWRVAVLVAHPDDETIGLGGQFGRLPGLTLIHATDGAPRAGGAAQAYGFDTPEAYAEARRRELAAALAIAGVPAERSRFLGFADQSTAFALPDLTRRLAEVLAENRIEVLLTHAYEGGHPDHEACAFAAQAARALLGAAGPAIVEMPFYHLRPDGDWGVQAFAPAGAGREPPPETVLTLDDETRARKRAMLDAHATQARTLARIEVERERFRPSPGHDFRRLPNDGRLLYEVYGWGLDGAGWRDLAAAALRELGLEAKP